MTKPTVFNYSHYDSLRDKCNEMAVDLAELTVKNQKLSKENDDLKVTNRRLQERLRNAEVKLRIMEEDNGKDKNHR
jgi:regulator of replication initiation timing